MLKEIMPGVYQFGPAPKNDEELREQYRKMRTALGKNQSNSESNHEEEDHEQTN